MSIQACDSSWALDNIQSYPNSWLMLKLIMFLISFIMEAFLFCTLLYFILDTMEFIKHKQLDRKLNEPFFLREIKLDSLSLSKNYSQ